MHHISFFVCPGYLLLDLAGPFGAFDTASRIAGEPLYRLSIISESGGLVTGTGGTSIATQHQAESAPDTIIFVGGDTDRMLEQGAVSAARRLCSQARRIASVCTGAFLLAETGCLDGRRVTTHWRRAVELQQRHPALRVDPDRIFLADGAVWTSAGVTAGIDLALALIEVDQDLELARSVARELVVHHRRSGGQSQFSEMSQMEPESDRIRRALNFARDHLSEVLSVERLADAAHLSVRQFGRAFRQETGETPARAIERLRVEAAHTRLCESCDPLERIALAVGFNDPERMRRAFLKIHGMSPQALRRISRANGVAADRLALAVERAAAF